MPTPDGETRGARVAILIDLAHLEAQAQQQGREIAWGRLISGLGRRRHVIRAIAYASGPRADLVRSTLLGNGIDLTALRDERLLPVSLAVDAMNLASRVDSVVLVPATDEFEPIARALRGQGIRVESADFTEGSGPDDAMAQSHHRLGDECLFEP